MLYDQWREVAKARSRELALKDLGEGQAWTFEQMLAHSDASDDPARGWVCPRGNGPEFVFEVLRGWRHNRPVCPLDDKDAPPPNVLPPAEIAHLKRTSATTEAARYVAFSGAQLVADCVNIVATMGLRPEWPNIAAISLAHSYGFSNLVLPLLLHGIPLLLLKSPLPEALGMSARKTEAFTLAGVPALWRAWHEAGAISPGIRLAVSAGAVLPLSLETEIHQHTGLKVHNFLGSTECGGIAYDRSVSPRTDSTLIGSTLENVSLSVRDGFLEVQGSAVGTGYWPEPREELRGGVFRTNDLVELRDGLLYMTGRASDVIHLAGRKVAPEEIEAVISKHPAVKECLVFGAPRNDHENQIVTLLVGKSSALEQIKQFAGSQLPAWKIPRQWIFVESLEANARGKVSRMHWREKFISRTM